ncbi:hypothetical protein D3P07_24350 [Paenibacillus sp. 1011MAR3C5]|uniref:hypothetical protein n=1 Tax=Paenibacillus sp. 1011MAR3C5 TaxID=1675787 RepID=UPI000E6BC024|nr:hypothetical protein [Paenibacillus sp. 1011MAR3C5]RJE83942.1 hypothetical protein D3P07_24350 [Paenibacillus sp. 1011MAR3C5]
MSFLDLGIPVDAVESRTAAVCTNPSGESRVVIAAKGFLLVVDPMTGDCRQADFPEGYAEYPYDTFSSRDGMLYMGAGTMFYAFDPFRLDFVDALRAESQDELCGFSYAENEHGHIYMASYPQCRLYRYRPVERDLIPLGQVDTEQKYPSHMAVDSHGWVYIGTGTARKNMIAYDSISGTSHSLLPDDLRTTGIGLVRQGYRLLPASNPSLRHQTCLAYALIGKQWVRLERGIVVENLTEDQVPASLYIGESFGKLHRQLPGEWEVIRHSLSERVLELKHRKAGQIRTIHLPYVSEGASLSPLFLGPDGNIYGTSNHPLHFFTYDPESARLDNLGPHVIEDGSGGNLAAYTTQGELIAGASYPGGRLHLYHTAKPIQVEGSPVELRNPICVTGHIEIHRPRCAVAMSEGEHIAYGGFPGYGMVGGGLCIYHLPTGEDTLIPHTGLIPHQSTVALAETLDGYLIGGTSIETPGGADPVSHTACLYRLDWKNRAVLNRWQPRSDIREYSLLLIDAMGRIHTLTSSSEYIVWDPASESILCEENLSMWGTIVRSGWQLDEADDCIYGVLSEAVFRIPLGSLKPERIAIPPQPVTSGFVKRGDTLFFAASTHLWSYSLSKG